MIRVPHLDRVGVELLESFRFGLGSHPLQLLDTRVESRLQVNHQRLNFRLRFRPEIFRRVKFADAEAQSTEFSQTAARQEISTAHRQYTSLPAHLLLFLAGKHLVVHLEISVGERPRKVRRGVIGDMHGMPGLQRLYRRSRPDCRKRRKCGLFADDHALQLRKTRIFKETGPSEPRREFR